MIKMIKKSKKSVKISQSPALFYESPSHSYFLLSALALCGDVCILKKLLLLIYF